MKAPEPKAAELKASAFDREARLRGVPRQSLIKLWIAERLKQETA